SHRNGMLTIPTCQGRTSRWRPSTSPTPSSGAPDSVPSNGASEAMSHEDKNSCAERQLAKANVCESGECVIESTTSQNNNDVLPQKKYRIWARGIWGSLLTYAHSQEMSASSPSGVSRR